MEGDGRHEAADLLHELSNALFATELAIDNAIMRLEALPAGADLDGVRATLGTALEAAERAAALTTRLRALEEARTGAALNAEAPPTDQP